VYVCVRVCVRACVFHGIDQGTPVQVFYLNFL